MLKFIRLLGCILFSTFYKLFLAFDELFLAFDKHFLAFDELLLAFVIRMVSQRVRTVGCVVLLRMLYVPRVLVYEYGVLEYLCLYSHSLWNPEPGVLRKPTTVLLLFRSTMVRTQEYRVRSTSEKYR
jgi:hypothetical protein